MSFATIIAYCDLLAVGVFAVSGALAAAEKRLDVLGFLFFGTVTGVGGGTLRDLLLDIPCSGSVTPVTCGSVLPCRR
jgi:uncharacterized membrane protein YeiH